MTKPRGFRIRERNSSHASLSQGPAQRQTRSFKDKDEYRVSTGALDIWFSFAHSRGNSRVIPRNMTTSRVGRVNCVFGFSIVELSFTYGLDDPNAATLVNTSSLFGQLRITSLLWKKILAGPCTCVSVDAERNRPGTSRKAPQVHDSSVNPDDDDARYGSLNGDAEVCRVRD
jgi:hypothetical protein